MKLTFGSASPLTLVDSPGNISYRNLRINGVSLAQEETLYNAAARVEFYRANEGTVLTLDTTWTTTAFPSPLSNAPYATPAAAEADALQFRALIAAIGRDTLILRDNSGSGLYTLYLHNAVIPEALVTVLGATVNVSYRVLGPAITTT